MHSISSKTFFYCTDGTEEKSVSLAQGNQENISTWDRGYLCHIASQPVRPQKFFSGSLSEGAQIPGSIREPSLLMVCLQFYTHLPPTGWSVMGGGGATGKGTFLLLAQEKQTGSHLLTQFFVVFAGKNITLSRCAPFKVVSDVEAVQGTI